MHAIDSDAEDELSRLLRHRDESVRETASVFLAEFREKPPEGLRVHCLGRFAVYKGEEEIPQERWTSRKARTLFKILVHERDKGFIPKDVLMEHLWPEQHPDTIINRFHVALTSLRKTLEPGLSRGAASSYLIRNGDSYRLDLGKGGWVDVDEFRKHVGESRDDSDREAWLAHCLEAEKLYRGDFFQEDLYDPWFSNERELLQQEYIAVLRRLMDYFEEKADYEMRSLCLDASRPTAAMASAGPHGTIPSWATRAWSPRHTKNAGRASNGLDLYRARNRALPQAI